MLRTTRSVLSALAIATFAGAAQADPVTFTWSPPSTPDNLNWSNPDNWTNDGLLTGAYPGDGRGDDIVLIPNDAHGQPVLNVSPAYSIQSVEVYDGATLNLGDSTSSGDLRELIIVGAQGLMVDAGGTVDIGQGQTYPYHNYYARITLKPISTNTMPIYGTVGLSANAEIRLENTGVGGGVTTTLGGTGSLKNGGVVRVKPSSYASTMVCGANLVITDTSGANGWVSDATGASATLRFDRAFTGTGDFMVQSGGSLNFQASVYTTGNYNGACNANTYGTGVIFYYNDAFDQCPQ